MEIKNKQGNLTIDKLRKYKGLERLSEIEANEAIESIEKLTVLISKLYQEQRINKGNGAQ